MSTAPQLVTPEQIHEARPDLSLETIRRHCRPGGPLAAVAVKVGRSWAVPADDAAAYVEDYERHAQSKRTPDAPPGAGGPTP